MRVHTTTAFLFLALLLPVHAAEESPSAEDDGFMPPPELHEGWYARIETSYGRILVRLLPEQSPQAVAHFASLAMGWMPWNDPVTGETRQGHYYDGVPIYKVGAGAFIETGDWTATGKGAPRLFIQSEGEGPVNFDGAYRLGMINHGVHTSGVQFFITVDSSPRRSGRHPCFATVVEGREVAFRLSTTKALKTGRPVEPLVIEKLRVFAIGEPEPLPEPVGYEPESRVRLDLKEEYRKP